MRIPYETQPEAGLDVIMNETTTLSRNIVAEDIDGNRKDIVALNAVITRNRSVNVNMQIYDENIVTNNYNSICGQVDQFYAEVNELAIKYGVPVIGGTSTTQLTT